MSALHAIVRRYLVGMGRHKTIRFRLLLAFLSLGAIPLILVGCILAWLIYQTQGTQALRLEQETVGRVAAEVQSFVDAFKRDLRFAARAQAIRDMNSRQMESLFGMLLSHQKAFREIALIDSSGREIVRVSRTDLVTDRDLRDLSHTELFRAPVENGVEYVGAVEFDPLTGEPVMDFAVPLDKKGTSRSAGALVVRVNLSRIWTVIQEVATRPGEAIYIVDGQGKLIAHPNPSIVLQGTWFVPPGRDGFFRGLSDKPSVLAHQFLELGGDRLTIVAERSLLSAQRLAIDVIGAVLVFLALVFIMASVLGGLIVNRIVQPINALAQVAGKISSGDLTQRVHVETYDEIGELARAFNTMTRKLCKSLDELTQEVAERKGVEAKLAAEKERLAVTLHSIGEGVIATDNQGSVLLLNRIAEELTGWRQDEVAGKPLADILKIYDEKKRTPIADHLTAVLKGHTTPPAEAPRLLISRNGNEMTIDQSVAPIRDEEGRIIGAVLVFRDITEELKIEEELRKTQKLESIGVLAGGIAHDFNNILTGILGNVGLAKMGVEQGSDRYTILAEAEKAASQAQNLTYQLLTFSTGGAPIKQLASVEEIIRDSASFSLRGGHVKCIFSFPHDLWSVEVDKGQISQVVQNLVINARQAMPEEGCIEISAENVTTTPETGASPAPGRYVQIQVTDHGVGIPPENLAKIFDPFFTTKAQGNGLGLATAYSIVKKHGGVISAMSTLGRGSTFTVHLPAVEHNLAPTTQAESGFMFGTGRILVMDDEEMVREATSKVLEVLGYEVECAQHGEEVIEKFTAARNQGKPFDLVILDLTVPGGLGGKETIARLRRLSPTVKALVTSGYSNDPIMANHRDHGFDGVVIKPYKVRDFSVTLHQVLAGAAA